MIATACKKAKKLGLLRANFPIIFCNPAKSKVSQEQLIPFDHFTLTFEALNGGFIEKRCPVAMATIGKTLFAHFRQVLHASAQYDQAITVFHRLKKRLEVSNLCSLSWDQTVTFSDLAHGLSRPGVRAAASSRRARAQRVHQRRLPWHLHAYRAALRASPASKFSERYLSFPLNFTTFGHFLKPTTTWIVLTKPSSTLLCEKTLAPSKVGLNRKRSEFRTCLMD